MNEKTDLLLQCYFQIMCKKPLDDLSMVGLSTEEALEELATLHEIFRPMNPQLSLIAYQKSAEDAADRAIEQFAVDPSGCLWKDLPLPTLRVLQERYIQAVTLLMANLNDPNGVKSFPVPAELRSEDRLGAVMIFYMHRMTLLLPASEESQLGADARLRHHDMRH